MENGWSIWTLKSRAFIIFLLPLFFVGCLNDNVRRKEETNVLTYDKLKSGDIVLRLGNGYFSSIFKNYASKEQKYSHIGIVSIENDTTYVYHSEASELTGVGKVKRESLNEFLNEISVFDFFRLEHANKAEIAEVAKRYFVKKTPFDLEFNSSNDSKLYCAELVAIAINTVSGETLVKPTVLLGNKKLYGLDDIYLKLRKLK